jgi:uncharacterized protein with HEPN domain
LRTDLERLADVKEAIERVEKYAARGRQAFDHDELIQTWIVHHIQIIGEACRLISAPFRDSHPEVPWKKIIGMRNALVHEYFGIDEDLVWDAVQRELPGLKRAIDASLRESGGRL